MPREAMGLGDVKLLAAIGAFLGWQADGVLACRILAGRSVVGLALIASEQAGLAGPHSVWARISPSARRLDLGVQNSLLGTLRDGMLHPSRSGYNCCFSEDNRCPNSVTSLQANRTANV